MPRDPQPTKDRILASAERLFAANGFDGISMRDIAADAGAQLALIHYHFGTKLDLYRAIWAVRYTEEVANLREARLTSIDFSLPVPMLVRTLVEIYLLPLVKMAEVDHLKDFLAIGARECTDPKEAKRGILKEFLDGPAKRFLEYFGKAMPELGRAEIAWGYQAMLGVSVLYIADRDRITRISGGVARAGDTKAATRPLVEFCVGGWLALWETRNENAGATRKRANKRTHNRMPIDLKDSQRKN
jgi:AcrR family transcriptional regulator